MSVTGAILALKPRILEFVERDVRRVEPEGAAWLSPQAILAAAARAKPGAAAAVNFGREEGTINVNPYTGVALGGGSERANAFFQSLTNWHRYVNLSGDSRETGKSGTGASNLAFLFLALTGLYLWWPKQLTRRYLKPIVWFRSTATPGARDFNWHNVIGFRCLPAFVIMTASGAVISYTWASDLVYRVTGSPMPERPGAGGRERPGRLVGGEPPSPTIPAHVDAAWARAERQMPTWSQISMRLPARDGAPIQFTLTDGAHWNKCARSSLTINGADAAIVRWSPCSASSPGQKARSWLRYAHTGELGYLPGQIVAGIGCLGGVMLVWTGVSLAFRRLWNWSLWTRWATVPASGDQDSLDTSSAQS